MIFGTEISTSIEFFKYPGLGIVDQKITPYQRGRIKFESTYWFARLHRENNQVNIMPGSSVLVIGREGITLIVISGLSIS